jgi:hypothetical protein
MPYSNPKQPIAIFLDIKRRQGLAAAKAFGAEHREEMKGTAQRRRKSRPYKSRRKR